MGEKTNHAYHAYLLRCWQEGEVTWDGQPVWRFSVEKVARERHRKGFSSLEALIAFLWAELASGEDKSDKEEEE